MKQTRRQKLTVLALVFLLAAVLCAPCAMADSTGGITLKGYSYLGADFIQFDVQSTLEKQLYFDFACVSADGTREDLAKKMPCEAGEIGFDVDREKSYEFVVYTIEDGEPANATYGRSAAVFNQLEGVGTVFATYVTVVEGTPTVYVPSSTYYDAAASREYDLVATAESYSLTYDAPTTIVPYRLHEQATLEGTVSFVDTKGNILEQNNFSVKPENNEGNPVYYPADGATLPQTLEKGGVTYVKANEVQRIKAVYTGRLDYTILYKTKQEDGAYTAVIRYIDDAGKLLLTDRVAVKDRVITYYAPTSFSQHDPVTSALVYYNTTPEKAKLVLQPGSATTEYEVVYTAHVDGRTYDWSIRLVDADTGALLGAQDLPVAANGSATYTPEATLSVGGVNYTVDAGMQSSYTHNYGDLSRVQYVYYNPAGYTPPTSYDLTVQYKNIADGSVLHSEPITAHVNQDAVFSCPKNYTFGGASYVRLNGQADTVTHNFYSPKRTYTIYYRDVNDTQYEDTVITVTEVITSERLEETIIYRAGAAAAPGATAPAAAGQTLTTVNNEETGENTLLTDEGVNTETAREEIADNQAPLAANSGEKKGRDFTPLMVGGIILAAVLLSLAAIVVVRRKKRRRPH